MSRDRNQVGSRLLEADPKLLLAEKRHMRQAPYRMDRSRRQAVLAACQDRCMARNWSLLAAHVRTTHVHLVVDAEARPERIMNDLKSYASGYLNRLRLDPPSRQRWTRHGSTRWLWRREDVGAAIRYVIDGQGAPMDVFVSADPVN